MKFPLLRSTLSLAVAALAACGGGGGDAPETELALSGVAATGRALAGAAIEVKCAGGSAGTTADATGAYSITLRDATLPCSVRATGTGDDPVVLHSIAEAGTTGEEERRTEAVANVTPLTELVLARLTGQLPTDFHAGFAGASVAPDDLEQATQAVLQALEDAGITLTSIDPFKAPLVAATDEQEGNAYDAHLDRLAELVPPVALPVLVNQVAQAADEPGGGMGDLVQAASGGPLAGCPYALSGTYRAVEYTGRVSTLVADFKAGTLTEAGATAYTITGSPEACAFSATRTDTGVRSLLEVRVAGGGAGAFRVTREDGSVPNFGYFFPAQTLRASALDAQLTWLKSGFIDGALGHAWGRMTRGADGLLTVCEYDDQWACQPDAGARQSLRARADGGLDFIQGGVAEGAVLYGYRAPDGFLALFGSTNPAGTNPGTSGSHFVAAPLAPAVLPEVGYVRRDWDVTLFVSQAGGGVTLGTTTRTFIAVDEENNIYTRRRESDGLIDQVQIGKPLPVLSTRMTVTNPNGTTSPPVVTFPMSRRLGLNATVNRAEDAVSRHLYVITVVKP